MVVFDLLAEIEEGLDGRQETKSFCVRTRNARCDEIGKITCGNSLPFQVEYVSRRLNPLAMVWLIGMLQKTSRRESLSE